MSVFYLARLESSGGQYCYFYFISVLNILSWILAWFYSSFLNAWSISPPLDCCFDTKERF